MALTSGFFNSKNHDRLYDATQISTLFEGLINDGVYQGVGNIFKVSASNGMNVTVDTGRAWFNNTWTRNDALIVLTVPTAEQVLKRIDAVVLEVNTLENVRNNTIKIVKGTPASSPAKPSLTKNDNVHQYPLAYITVDPNVTAIKQQKIQNAVGTSACPFVTGIIDTLDIDDLIAQWGSEFNVLFAELQEQISQAASQTIIDGSVTRPKLANDALYSPNVHLGASSAAFSLSSNSVGKTFIANNSKTDFVITVPNDESIPVGFEVALFRFSCKSMKITFASGIKVLVYGNTSPLTAPTFNLESYAMVALKKISDSGYWLLTGPAEVV